MCKQWKPDHEDNPFGEYCWCLEFGAIQIACNYWGTNITGIKMRKYLYTTGWTKWVDIQFTLSE